MPLIPPLRGVPPALQAPYREDYSIDERELRRFVRWLASHDGIGGLVANGHTGEVFARRPAERAEVTGIAAGEMSGRLLLISGICRESSAEAAEHAVQAKEAGASGLLVTPPHNWVRFGMKKAQAVYAAGAPSGEAHVRMKTAMVSAGGVGSELTRPPIRPPRGEIRERIQAAVDAAAPGPVADVVEA